MKGKSFRRLTTFVLVLATILSLCGVNTTVADAKSKGSVVLLRPTGKYLLEGFSLTESMVRKTVKATENGKSIRFSVKKKQTGIGKTIKPSKKGKKKLTVRVNGRSVSVSVKVNYMTDLYLKKTKLILVEGEKFQEKNFRKNSTVMAGYQKGKDKKFANYKIKAAKTVKANKKGLFPVTISYAGKNDSFKKTIYLKVVKKATSTTTPTPTPPTIVPTKEPTPSPTATPSEEPTPTATVTPSEEPTPTATVTPSEEPTPTATVTPSEEPTPTATVTPSEEPTPTATATPSEEPTPTPTATVFHKLNLNGAEVIRYEDGKMNAKGEFSYNTHIWVKSVIPLGQKFTKYSDERGEILSYDEIYDFRLKGPMTVTANFSSVEEEKKPTVHFTGQGIEVFPALKTVMIYLSIEIPEGFEKQEYGFIYSSENLSEDEMTLENAKKVKDESSSTTGSADFTYSARFNNQAIWDAGEYRYFRPYGIVKDKNGDLITIYGSIKSAHLTLSQQAIYGPVQQSTYGPIQQAA